MSMHIGCLVNWYPQPSLTWIRGEVRALEELGVFAHRVTIRSWKGPLFDENDIAEREQTRALLDAGVPRFLWAVFSTVLSRPFAFTRAEDGRESGTC